MVVPKWIDNALFEGCHSEESKNRSAYNWWAELHAVFLALMEELNSDKSPYIWHLGFYWLMGNGQWPGLMAGQEGNGNLAYSRDAHVGHGPKEIIMSIWGVH